MGSLSRHFPSCARCPGRPPVLAAAQQRGTSKDASGCHSVHFLKPVSLLSVGMRSIVNQVTR